MYDTARRVALVKQRVRENARQRQRREAISLSAACMLLFAALILRGYWIALHTRDRFGTLLVVGFTTQLAVQVFLNIGVVTGLLPTTGISLPFFSYGGTALLIQLAEMGVILSVSRQMKPTKAG